MSDPILSSERTGAATSVSRETLASLPTVSQRLQDIVRLTPQYGGTMSFAGQDSRMNNITVDGAYFNNSFGLRNGPGDTSGVAPISLDAIEQIQVNIAPYDVRQGNFVGASVNTVTRSGGNQFRGSVYRQFRNESMVGTKAKGLTVNPGHVHFRQYGLLGVGSGQDGQAVLLPATTRMNRSRSPAPRSSPTRAVRLWPATPRACWRPTSTH